MDPAGERLLIHKGGKFDFEVVRFPGRSGRTVEREMVRHPGAVCTLPVLAGVGSAGPAVVLIRNRRFTIGRDLWELPAGTIEPGEVPLDCAVRELEEETGYRAGRIVPLGTFYTTPGMTDELMHAFAATGLEPVGQRLEEDEQVRPVVVPAAEALAMIDRGELMDAKSIVTLLLGWRKGLIGPWGALP